MGGGAQAWVGLRGWSMAPSLVDGDWLRVEPLPGGAGAARVGDVVLMRRAGRLVAHRVDGVAAAAATRRDGRRRLFRLGQRRAIQKERTVTDSYLLSMLV